MKNLVKSISDEKAPVKLVFKAEILNQDGEIIVSQNLVFESPVSLAINDAIDKMGKSFLYGLAGAISTVILDSQKEKPVEKK